MGKRRRRINRKRLSGLITVLLLAVLVFVRGCAEIRQREPDRQKMEESVADAEQTDTEQTESEGYPTVETLSGESLSYTDCLTVEATAYSGGGKTALGTAAGEGTVAVDPDVIPLGSRLYIVSEDGSSWEYGYAVAEDTGSSIQGERIDLFFWSERDCQEFGRKMATVYVLAQ